MQVQSALFFETPEQIFRRVYVEFRPRSPLGDVRVAFCRFAGASSFIRLEDGRLQVRISDVLEGAPAPIHEALANILIAKLLRKPVPAAHRARYRRFMNRADVRRNLHLLRQIRGRKYVSGARGEHYDIEEIFEELNLRFFHGLMARPQLGWSRQASRVTLGHFDPSHNAIILSRFLDRAEVPRLVVEYVVFHEMLHLRYPVEHHGARRSIHTAEFRAAEKEFPALKEAKALLKQLCAR